MNALKRQTLLLALACAGALAAAETEIRVDETTTLAALNAREIAPGTKVLFKRGGVWRGQLRSRSGLPGRPVVYGAYGTGAKPVIEPSYDRSRAADWTDQGNGVWRTETGAKADIGNIILDHGAAGCAFKRGAREALTRDLDFWCDPKTFAVYFRTGDNPARRWRSLELAEKIHGVDISAHDVVYDGLAVRYTAAHGFGGSSMKRITIRNCDISWIGGGYLYFDKLGNGVRFGNGIEFWGNAEDALVESNRVWEVWDAGFTNQSSGRNDVQRNIVYRGNEAWNCEYSYEYWQQGDGSVTENILVDGNVFRDAGKGWGHRQRWNPNAAHLMFYDSTAKTTNFVVRGNVFAQSEDVLFRLFNDWRANLTFEKNRWVTDRAPFCRFHGRPTANLRYRYPDRLDQIHDDNAAEIESQGSGARLFTKDQEAAFKAFIGER